MPVRVMGIEPMTHGLKGRCSTELSYTLARRSKIEQKYNQKNSVCQIKKNAIKHVLFTVYFKMVASRSAPTDNTRTGTSTRASTAST